MLKNNVFSIFLDFMQEGPERAIIELNFTG